MTGDDVDLQGFGDAARRAVARAEGEARELGHDRLGTEHLLLGLLGDGASEAGAALAATGLTLAAARHKVSEAVGPQSGGLRPGDRPAMTARAARAIGRSRRFSHSQRAGSVETVHLLLGVLDVEGTAGQVLRGLGVDLDRLRAPLVLTGDDDGGGAEAAAAAVSAARAKERPPARATCPSCGADLGGDLAYQAVTAIGAHGPRPAIVYSCNACGRLLGVAPN